MPIYNYECKSCGNKFELLVRQITDEPQCCPQCGQPAEKIPSVPSKFQWGRGGGWT